MKPLIGIHHVTAITSSAEKIYDFFTNILGLRLVKKTINQDDIHTYHLFFADDKGSAGTDMTFFDFKGINKAIKGTNEIAKTGFRVPNDKALAYFKIRFEKYGIDHQNITSLFEKQILEFTDFDGQEYFLISDQDDQGVPSGTPWLKGPIPNEVAITGLGPIFLRVKDVAAMKNALENILTFKVVKTEKNLVLLETGAGGNGASVILEHDVTSLDAIQGYGGVHHVAFRIDDQNVLNQWIEHFNQHRISHSGYVDRFYFQSLYTRLYPKILFELATEGPGFIDDEESYETLGETLALPPKFRNQRARIEQLVRHIDTVRSNKAFVKEYL